MKSMYTAQEWGSILVSGANIFSNTTDIYNKKSDSGKTDEANELAIISTAVAVADLAITFSKLQKQYPTATVVTKYGLGKLGASLSIADLARKINNPESEPLDVVASLLNLASGLATMGALATGTSLALPIFTLSAAALIIANRDGISDFIISGAGDLADSASESVAEAAASILNDVSSVFINRAQVKSDFYTDIPVLAKSVQSDFNDYVDEQFSLLDPDYQDSGSIKEDFFALLSTRIGDIGEQFSENVDNLEEVSNSDLKLEYKTAKQTITNIYNDKILFVSDTVESLLIGFAESEIHNIINSALDNLEAEYSSYISELPAKQVELLSNYFSNKKEFLVAQIDTATVTLASYSEASTLNNKLVQRQIDAFIKVIENLVSDTTTTFRRYAESQTTLANIIDQSNANFDNEIYGDFAPLDQDLSEPGIQVEYNQLGNLIVGNEIEIRRDVLFGGSQNDLIYGGDENDYIEARGGNDVLYGGGNNDEIWGQQGNDILIGGTGTDILSGGAGNDQLYANNQVEDFQSTQGNNSNRDWLAGGEGNDLLVGAAGGEVLAGGSGDDTIYANEGDDYIISDKNWVASDFTWNVDHSENRYTFSSTSIDGSGDDGKDTVYAGSGSDHVFSGGGDDIIFAEEGDDVVFGGGGSDTIYGGAGNDTISGGSSEDSPSKDSDDTIWGGAGDDLIHGEGVQNEWPFVTVSDSSFVPGESIFLSR